MSRTSACEVQTDNCSNWQQRMSTEPWHGQHITVCGENKKYERRKDILEAVSKSLIEIDLKNQGVEG